MLPKEQKQQLMLRTSHPSPEDIDSFIVEVMAEAIRKYQKSNKQKKKLLPQQKRS